MIDNLSVVFRHKAYVDITFIKWDIPTEVCELV